MRTGRLRWPKALIGRILIHVCTFSTKRWRRSDVHVHGKSLTFALGHPLFILSSYKKRRRGATVWRSGKAGQSVLVEKRENNSTNRNCLIHSKYKAKRGQEQQCVQGDYDDPKPRMEGHRDMCTLSQQRVGEEVTYMGMKRNLPFAMGHLLFIPSMYQKWRRRVTVFD